MVRLRVAGAVRVRLGVWNFNSKMVRLRVKSPQFVNPRWGFQFQNGAIERRLGVSTSGCLDISIPKWCDWEDDAACNAPGRCLISIPKWCDWEEDIKNLREQRYVLFQFQNGAIERKGTHGNREATFGFQFQNGAIERITLRLTHRFLIHFNSKMVRLRGFFLVVTILRYRHFNSKMVRLRAYSYMCNRLYSRISIPKWCDWESCQPHINQQFLLFQFQNGAIESAVLGAMSKAVVQFQFQNGAIERLRQELWILFIIYFNSKMVRLRARYGIPQFGTTTNFNSKMVRLRVASSKESRFGGIDFNSKMVRLREQ